MRVLVLGGSGATGKLVVAQLLKRKINTRILIRETAVVSETVLGNSLLETVRGNVSELSETEMQSLVDGCSVVISCLGHNVTFTGLFGNPRRLVFEAVKRICETATAVPGRAVRLILMSTTAYTNRFSGEKNSTGERIIFFLLKLLLPPHRDNVDTADYLIHSIGSEDERIAWIAVRPDGLVDEDAESTYELQESPLRSPIFDAGRTSRINVSRFMAELVTDEQLWTQWRFKTPVIYNS